MFFLLQACFWIKAALEHVFLSPLRPHALNLLGQGFLLLWFCFCPKATLENVVPVGVFFWREAALDKVWNWEDFRLSGREVCRMIFFWRTAGENIWEFRTIDVKVRRFEHMCVCESEGVRVWRWENLQMWRGHKIKKKGVKMRGWDYVRNWKCEVKNINRKVTVCKNVLYIKIIAKEKTI